MASFSHERLVRAVFRSSTINPAQMNRLKAYLLSTPMIRKEQTVRVDEVRISFLSNEVQLDLVYSSSDVPLLYLLHGVKRLISLFFSRQEKFRYDERKREESQKYDTLILSKVGLTIEVDFYQVNQVVCVFSRAEQIEQKRLILPAELVDRLKFFARFYTTNGLSTQVDGLTRLSTRGIWWELTHQGGVAGAGVVSVRMDFSYRSQGKDIVGPIRVATWIGALLSSFLQDYDLDFILTPEKFPQLSLTIP